MIRLNKQFVPGCSARLMPHTRVTIQSDRTVGPERILLRSASFDAERADIDQSLEPSHCANPEWFEAIPITWRYLYNSER